MASELQATTAVCRRFPHMFTKAWQILKFTGNGYIEDNCLSRGAAIAYYTVFSLAPVLIIVIAIAGFVFGADAARGALLDEITSLMGRQGGEAIQTMIASASNQNRSGWAGAIGLITLLVKPYRHHHVFRHIRERAA